MASRSMKTIVTSMLRRQRVMLSCRVKLGVDVSLQRRLVRMTNVRMIGSRLDDATCQYQYRIEVAGDTYPVRELLKKWGLKWDAGHDAWVLPVKQGVETLTVAERLLKVTAKRGMR